MKFRRNRNPLGNWNAFMFGLCSIGDGLVRVLTLGYVFSSLAIDQTRRASLRNLANLKKARELT